MAYIYLDLINVKLRQEKPGSENKLIFDKFFIFCPVRSRYLFLKDIEISLPGVMALWPV